MKRHVADIRFRRKANPLILLDQKKRRLRIACIKWYSRRDSVLFQKMRSDRSRILLRMVQDELLVMKL